MLEAAATVFVQGGVAAWSAGRLKRRLPAGHRAAVSVSPAVRVSLVIGDGN